LRSDSGTTTSDNIYSVKEQLDKNFPIADQTVKRTTKMAMVWLLTLTTCVGKQRTARRGDRDWCQWKGRGEVAGMRSNVWETWTGGQRNKKNATKNWRWVERNKKGLRISSLFVFTIEIKFRGGIKTRRYLGKLLEKVFLLNSLNFNLGRVFGEILKMP
jgi:hypothetical protein